MAKSITVISTKALANFLFEVGILSKTPRSGFYFLGSGNQTVAEHIHRTVYSGLVLATIHGKADILKVLKMCLFHDLAEARTSDLNYVIKNMQHQMRLLQSKTLLTQSLSAKIYWQLFRSLKKENL